MGERIVNKDGTPEHVHGTLLTPRGTDRCFGSADVLATRITNRPKNICFSYYPADSSQYRTHIA